MAMMRNSGVMSRKTERVQSLFFRNDCVTMS